MGDAVCSFNPIYGQGMTVAALQALALRHHLHAGTARPSRRIIRAIAGRSTRRGSWRSAPTSLRLGSRAFGLRDDGSSADT